MKFRFGISSILFLGIVLGTIVLWIGFEFYHRQNNVDIPAKLRQHANSPLPNSFDSETLIDLYQNSKENFYEPSDSQNSPSE